jgi:hypothetical protein
MGHKLQRLKSGVPAGGFRRESLYGPILIGCQCRRWVLRAAAGNVRSAPNSDQTIASYYVTLRANSRRHVRRVLGPQRHVVIAGLCDCSIILAPISCRSRCLPKLAIGSLIFALLAIVACSPESAQNDPEKTCALKLYPNYDVTRLDQCMNVCKSCRNGNTVTCSTSCKLKGAS